MLLNIQIVIFYIFKKTFQFLDFLIPKNPQVAIFASKSGKSLNGNIVLPFEVAKKSKKVRAYLISSSPQSLHEIKIYSLRGLWIILRAKFVFITHGPNDIFYAHYSSRKIVTYVGHGVPVKSFVFTNRYISKKENFKQKLEVPTYKYIIASSEEDKRRLVQCFDFKAENVLVTGLPRNDLLFLESTKIKSLYPENKLALYAPTFRDDQSFKFFPFEDFSFDKMNHFLETKKTQLFLRCHVNDKTKQEIGSYSNIHILGQEDYPEIQEVLSEFDGLITDYSSIYIDYLLLNRPLAFIPYDLERYKQKRGIIYSYNEVTPGPKINSFEGFKSFIENNFFKEVDEYAEERKRVRNFFHKYDNGFTQRMLKTVIPNYE